ARRSRRCYELVIYVPLNSHLPDLKYDASAIFAESGVRPVPRLSRTLRQPIPPLRAAAPIMAAVVPLRHGGFFCVAGPTSRAFRLRPSALGCSAESKGSKRMSAISPVLDRLDQNLDQSLERLFD